MGPVIRLALIAFPLAVFISCGPVKGTCTASTCAGCCDAQQFCQLNYTASACGKGGGKCVACATSETCAEGVCTFFGTVGGGAGGGAAGGSGGNAGGGAGGTGGGAAGGGGGAMGGGAGGGAGGGTAAGGGSGAFDAGATHFAPTPFSWPVPASGLADGFMFPKFGASVRFWDTLDLDGDGKPDLVHTANPATGQVWLNAAGGGVYWKVYRNLGNGFATMPTLWPVPASGLADGFLATASATNFRQWATFDIDHDGKPDLVQTANPATNQVWAGPLWKVFKNTGTGFSTTAINWPVPAAPPLTLPDGYNAKDSAANPKPWSTLDLDGDGFPDLVLTSTAGTVFVGGTKPEWHVHKNMGNGFAPTFTAWPVPASGLADGFTMPNSRASTREWATVDLDGDGLPDLVQTANTVGGAVWLPTDGGAQAFWKVYPNLGTGFAATFTAWPVPPNGLTDGFYATELLVTSRRWTTRDLNGDGRPDLVHTTNPANGQVFVGADGGAYWNYYRNTGTGFAVPAAQWTVPPTGLAEGFFSHVSSVTLTRWMTFDLDGDGTMDLVHTTNVMTDTVWTNTAAAPIWKVYRGEL